MTGLGLAPAFAASSGAGRALPDLGTGFSGQVLARGEPGYEQWRQSMVWQRIKPERFPTYVIRPQTTGDIQKVMQFASRNSLRVAVRSGGHNIWSSFLRDDGVLLDLSRFRDYEVLAGKGSAWVGPSLWARDLTDALLPAGYAFPVAHCATVPLGGYLLGGGLGLNGDEWGGMACHSIIGAEVVTADGDVLLVDENSQPDLLWSLRGGGGAFPGIVSRYHIRTWPAPRTIEFNTYVFPIGELDQAMNLLTDAAAFDRRDTELLMIMVHNPQAPPDAPPEMRKACAVRAQVFDTGLGGPEIFDFMAAHPSARNAVFRIDRAPTTFEQLAVESMDWKRGFGFGRYAVDNIWTNNLESSVAAAAKVFADAPSWKTHVVVQPKWQATATDSAFSASASTYLAGYAVWDEPEHDDENKAWLGQFMAEVQPWTAGNYINEFDVLANANRNAAAFSKEAWARLGNLRREYDPDQVLESLPGLA